MITANHFSCPAMRVGASCWIMFRQTRRVVLRSAAAAAEAAIISNTLILFSGTMIGVLPLKDAKRKTHTCLTQNAHKRTQTPSRKSPVLNGTVWDVCVLIFEIWIEELDWGMLGLYEKTTELTLCKEIQVINCLNTSELLHLVSIPLSAIC